MNNELAKVFSQLAAAYQKQSDVNKEMSQLFSRAAKLCGNVADVVKPSTDIESDEEFLPKGIFGASNGEVSAILKLKKLARKNIQSKKALEKLYYDGQKENAVGTLILRDGLEYS